MAVYVSCAACGWRGCDSYLNYGFQNHTCIRRNGYVANGLDKRSGWPPDHETHRRLGRNARFAINWDLGERNE